MLGDDRNVPVELLKDHLRDGQPKTHTSLVHSLRLLDSPEESEESPNVITLNPNARILDGSQKDLIDLVEI
jgi:hypothetical protein